MKKRGVSPVIATILLIALVTAAAAIVFLVVIPMLNPAPKAIVQEVIAVEDVGTNNYTVTISVQAVGQDITFNGTVVSSPSVTYMVVTTTLPVTIDNGNTGQIIIVGSFVEGTEYTLTLTFYSGDSIATGIAVFTP